MIKVYIASPYTKGDTGENVKIQMRVFDQLAYAGYVPFAPLWAHFQNIYYPRGYASWIAWSMEWLLCCDAVLRLPGKSPGADAEVEMAKQKGIFVFYSFEDLLIELPPSGKVIAYADKTSGI